MENLIFSLNATIPVFLVMVIGYVLKNLKVIDEPFTKTLNSFNFKITLPVLLFKDISDSDFLTVWDTRYVLFCFLTTLFCIASIWIIADKVYHKKDLVGEFVQASYRGSAAVLGIAFIQNIYGNAGMAPLMIIGTVPLYNMAAFYRSRKPRTKLRRTEKVSEGDRHESDHSGYSGGYSGFASSL